MDLFGCSRYKQLIILLLALIVVSFLMSYQPPLRYATELPTPRTAESIDNHPGNGGLDPDARQDNEDGEEADVETGLDEEKTRRDNEAEEETAAASTAQVCSRKLRQTLVRSHCDQGDSNYTLHRPGLKGSEIRSKKIEPGQTMGGIFVAQDEQFFLCRICKAGARSASNFFGRLNGGENVKRFPSYTHYVNSLDSSPPKAVVAIKLFPMSKVLEDYKQFKKILIVRHPLQRLMSAYYQVVGEKMPDAEGITTVEDYIEKLVLSDEWYNPHWIEYANSCFPCQIQYDFIMKTETLNEEFPSVGQDLGFGRVSYSHVHQHSDTPSDRNLETTKYDEDLRELEARRPELFQRILDMYALDMKMFGYGWKDGHSYCGNEISDCC